VAAKGNEKMPTLEELFSGSGSDLPDFMSTVHPDFEEFDEGGDDRVDGSSGDEEGNDDEFI
jgi:hypothetical protein